MNVQLSVQDWLNLSHSTRGKLVEIFNIPRSSGSVLEVGGTSVVKSDGHTYEDLGHITIEKMKKFLYIEPEKHTDEDFPTLFHKVVLRIEEDKELEVKEEVVDNTQLLLDEWDATLRRIRGQAIEKDLEHFLIELIKTVFQLETLKIKQNDNGTQRLPAKTNKTKQRGTAKNQSGKSS